MRSVNTNNRAQFIGALVCVLGAVFYSYEYLLRILPGVMENALRVHFDLSATSFGLLSAFYYYAYVPMQIPVGVMLDRVGPRLLLTFACTACVLGTFLFTVSTNFIIAASGRFLVGFGSAFAYVGVLKLATIWLPEDRLALVAGLTSALGVIGAMLGDNFVGDLVEKIGWVQTMEYAAIFGVILTIFLWAGIRDTKRGNTDKFLETHGTIGSFKRSMLDLLIIAKNKQIWLTGLYGCLVYLPTTVFGELWGIPYLIHARNLTQIEAGMVTSLLFFGFMIGAPVMGLISDKMKMRRPPMFIGAIGAGVIISLILYFPDLTILQMKILMFALGVFYSAQCIVFAVGRELSPTEAAGTAFAAINMLVMLGAMLLQPLVGRLLDFHMAKGYGLKVITHPTAEAVKMMYSAGDYKFAMSIIPIGIFLASILVLFIKETYADAKE